MFARRARALLSLARMESTGSLVRAVAPALTAFFALGCVGGDSAPPPVTSAGDLVESCEDADGDGFGPGCVAGADCDDGRVDVTDECRCDGAIAEGCPCQTESALASCGEVSIQIGNQTICGMGYSTCDQGLWGPCIINSAAELSGAGVTTAQSGSFPDAVDCDAFPDDPRCGV